jgi:hypothetical protein
MSLAAPTACSKFVEEPVNENTVTGVPLEAIS